MKKIKISIPLMLSFLPVLLLVQCTEKIDIKLGNNQPRLVVEGMITNEAIAHTIRLTTTTDYFYTAVAPAVTQANVTIDNGTTTINLIEKPENSGIYVTPDNYIGIPGIKYTLNIILKNAINGQTVFTASEVMPKPYKPDSIEMNYRADWGKKGFWETLLYLQDPPEVNFYSFRGLRNDTLVTDTLNKVGIRNDKFLNNMYLQGLTSLYWNQEYISEKIKVGDKITLQVGAITKEYYTFLDEIKLEVEPKNPLFSGPSSNVSTNISNGGLGYFAVCAMSYVSTTMK
jgi:hypothetical protein